VGSVIGYYDQKVIEQRRINSTGAAAQLFDKAWQRQRGLVRTSPLTIANAFVQVGLVYFFPDLFITNHAHLILVVIQIAAFVLLTWRTITQFKQLREQIVDKAVEELESEDLAK
jgi:hypothetical protein